MRPAPHPRSGCWPAGSGPATAAKNEYEAPHDRTTVPDQVSSRERGRPLSWSGADWGHPADHRGRVDDAVEILPAITSSATRWMSAAFQAGSRPARPLTIAAAFLT